jgi:sterol desaturase/sphingolipid hydroxylase (fatty acid hydroxylase superfamily)
MLYHVFESLVARVPTIFWTFILAFVVERLLPIDAMISGRGLLLNCIVGLFFLFVQELSFLALAFLLVHPRLGLISLFAVSDGGNIPKAFCLAFFWLAMRDFFYYWLHRLQHASKWLWAEHALHHSDEHVNVTTSVRHHWLEMPMTIILVNVPLLLLLRPPVITLTFVGAILSLTEFSNHMNFQFGLGRFSWLIVTPQNHRIHHSKLEQHFDKNFAAFFPLWDVIFGTYYAPKKDEYPPTGLASGERVTTVRQALFLPFAMWRRMLVGASGR